MADVKGMGVGPAHSHPHVTQTHFECALPGETVPKHVWGNLQQNCGKPKKIGNYKTVLKPRTGEIAVVGGGM